MIPLAWTAVQIWAGTVPEQSPFRGLGARCDINAWSPSGAVRRKRTAMMCLVRRISIESCAGKCGRRLVALILFPSTPQAHSRPTPRQLSPTVALDDALGQPLDDVIEAEAFVKRTATVLVRYVVPRQPAAARSQRPAASLPVHSHSSRPSNRCPRSVGRAAGRRYSV